MFWSGRTGSFVLLLLMALSLCTDGRCDGPAAPPLPEGFQLRTFHDEQGEHRYLLFLPRGYSAARRWPVVLSLHGAGEKGDDGLLPLSVGLPAALEAHPDAPFIAVFPQCEDTRGRSLTGWLADSPDGIRARKILDEVEQNYAVDPRRRTLVGWSMGGYGAWSLAAADPEHWQAVLALAGGELGGDAPSLDLQQLASSQTPVWAVHGRKDSLVPASRSEGLIERLQSLKGNGTLTLLDAEHDIWRTVFANRGVLDWLADPTHGLPSAEELSETEPLPVRSRFYRERLSQVQLIPGVIGLRFGNDALKASSAALPDLLPPDSLHGRLDDIHRTLGSGHDPIHVSFFDVRYECQVDHCDVEAVSGGWLKIKLAFKPLEMTLGETRLHSREHQAWTGPIVIQLGKHRPAVLELDVQPVMQQGVLRLRLLRKQFRLDPSNWYIRPPDEVRIQSETYTRRHIVSGIVGSLYQSQSEIIDEVLGAVPEILESVESKLRSQPAPRLAKALSPLPVLVPDLEVRPAQLTTDKAGFAIVFDLALFTRAAPEPIQLQEPWSVSGLGTGEQLELGIGLEAIERISSLGLRQNTQQVNVLDIGEPSFERFANVDEMSAVAPGLKAENVQRLSASLRLMAPLRVEGCEVVRQGATGNSLVQVQVSCQQAGLDLWDVTAPTKPRGLGRVVFSLSQQVEITIPHEESERRSSAIQTRWAPDCNLTFLGVEPLSGAAPIAIDEDGFARMLRESWLAWTASRDVETVSLATPELKSLNVILESLRVQRQRLEATLSVESTPTKN